MNASVRLGRIAGVQVGVHWSVLVIVVILASSLGGAILPDGAPGYPSWAYWVVAVVAAIAFAASILAHELSHAVVANREGVPVDSIVLWLFGGVAKLRANARTARSELRIALAGPAMSLAIGVLAVAAAIGVDATGRFDLVATALAWLGGINLVLAVFNLMPGAPLDGGRVLTAILWKRGGDEHRARRRAGNAGRVVGFVLMGLGAVQFAFVGVVGLWTALVGWLIISMARMEMAQNELQDALAGVTVADVMTADTVAVSDQLSVAEFMSGPWRHRALWPFPIVDPAGRPLGLVTLERITDVAPHLWPSTPLAAVAVPVDELCVARPEDPLLDVLQARTDPHAGVLVTSGERVVGVLRPSDVNRAVERLVRPPHRSGTPPVAPLPPPPPTPRGWARHG